MFETLNDPDIDIDIDDVMDELIEEGIEKFVKPYDLLLESIENQAKELTPA